MDMNSKEPFDYPMLTYLWVIGLSAVAAAIRYLNSMEKFAAGRLFIEALSGGFTGLLTFWLCQWQNINGPLMAFLIGVSGLMGSRVWNEFMHVFRSRSGIPHPPPTPEELRHEQPVQSPK